MGEKWVLVDPETVGEGKVSVAPDRERGDGIGGQGIVLVIGRA